MTLVRFVHYVESNKRDSKGSDRTPGVRYFCMEDQPEKSLTWGSAVQFNFSDFRSAEKINRTIVLPPQYKFDFVPDAEKELAESVAEAFSEANKYPGDNENHPNAKPIADSRKGKGGNSIWARIHVYNVGQGDTIVLELPDEQLWLLDARLWGQSQRDRFRDWMRCQFPSKDRFDKVIVSHLHYDHIHSIPWIFNNYTIGELLVPGSLHHPTSSAKQVLNLATNQLFVVSSNQIIQFGQLKVQIMVTQGLPSFQNSKDPNDHEIAVILCTDNDTAFLSGDIPGNMCDELITRSILTNTRRYNNYYYKVSHHGSMTGYDRNFFRAYPATDAIISCGASNRYNHPHQPPIGYFSCNYVKQTHRDANPACSFVIR